jgi:lactaldehyde reductase
MFHIKAIELIAKYLRKSVAGEGDGGEKMALAQYIAGMGFSNVGLGIDHAMAHTLSAHYDVPHGKACAMLLPISMEFNKETTGDKLKYIAEAFGVDTTNMSQDEYRNAAIAAVRKLGSDVGVPTYCEEIREEDLDVLASDALKDACYPGNPREATHEQVVELFRLLLKK